MELIKVNNQTATVSLSHEELIILNAALNEVCHGIAVFEFETRIGASKEEVAILQKTILSLVDQIDENKA